MSLPWPLLLVLVWERTGDGPHGDLLLGLTAAARMLPYVLLSWATGMLADRFRRDRLVRVTLAARAVLLAGVALAVTEGWLLVAVLAAALAVACGTPAYPALAAAMPAAAGPARRRATDLLVTIEVASFVVGPAIGGLVLAVPTRSLSPALAVALTLLAAAGIAGVALPRPAPVDRRPAVSPRPLSDASAADGRGSARGAVSPEHGSRLGSTLRASSSARRAIGVAGLLNAVDAVLVLALLPVTAELWHEAGSSYGLATGMLGFGAVAAPLLWRLGSSARGRARWGLLLLGGSLAVVPATPAVAWAALPLVVAGAASVHVEGAVTEAIQDAVPDSQRAGALGLTDSVMVGAGLMGSLAAPWLSSATGPGVLLLLLAGTSVATVALLGRGTASTAGDPDLRAERVPAQRPGSVPAQRAASGGALPTPGANALAEPEG
jgi:MFS family permease